MNKHGTIKYVWDNAKNTTNQGKHGISFEDAVEVFDGPTIQGQDTRFEYGENRMFAIGLMRSLEVTVIYTDREDDQRRIISARLSSRSERRKWRDHYGDPLSAH